MSKFLLLTSPPASGKTFWIDSFSRECDEKILVISPLRALADECRTRWGEKILVMTPEEWLLKKQPAAIVIFDEFHLLTYWGDSFRPCMWEVFYGLCSEARLVIGLTATLSEELKEELGLFSCHFEEVLWADAGNRKLKWVPSEYVVMKKRFLEKCVIHLRLRGTTLIFCKYREEIPVWKERLEHEGFRVWTCVGGKAAAFGERVRSENPPDFIVSTTVLSHGVNLPTIRRVILLYEIRNLDFWIQMVARGGRKGESFEVFALEPPHGLRWSRRKNLLSTARLSAKLINSVLIHQLEQCFLKE